MMKRITKSVAAVLTAIIVMQTVCTASAFEIASMTQEEWNGYYASLCDENTLPTLCVGADETQLNLTWHADKVTAQARVLFANNSLMLGANEFKGETVAAENDEQYICRVTVTGIKADSLYYYKWYTNNGWSKAYEYRTRSFDSYKMLVVGDIQIGGQSDNSNEQSRIGYAWQNLLDEALSVNPDVSFLLSPGDNTSTGKTANEWQTLLMPESLRSLPMALAIGNHDKKGYMYNYYTFMPNEYYGRFFKGLDRDFWFRYGDVLYLVFDATSGSAADHKAMAEEAVKANPDAKWRIGVMHQALYGPGYSMLDPETRILLNAVFQPIFEMCDLDFVFTGHSHLQGRSHFVKNGAVVQRAESGKTYTDPEGIIYLNSNAVCNQGSTTAANPFIAYALDESVVTYTTVEFTDSMMSVKTFRGDNSELLDSVAIEKTENAKDLSSFGGVRGMLYKIVELLGFIYMSVDEIIVEIRGGHY